MIYQNNGTQSGIIYIVFGLLLLVNFLIYHCLSKKLQFWFVILVLMIQTLDILNSIIHCLKFQRLKMLNCKDKRVKKLKFETINQ